MEENQTNQNLNQQPVQPQPEQVQQPVQWQTQPAQTVEEPTVSMQIQQLLVQQQQYQKQYNELVDYVKKTPNLPIEQVNQIKAQLDQLNALFVEWKQKLQALWYNQVQVQKPTEIKKWSVTNFSWKKVAIWCGIVLLIIFTWFFITLSTLIKNPNALAWIWVYAATAKLLLKACTGLIFWSVILIMLWVIISNIYRLITVKNQWKWKFIRWLIWWLFWAWVMWALMWLIFWWIWKIVTDVVQKDYDIIQPYLVWRVEEEWIDEFNHPYDDDVDGDPIDGEKYPLIAPSEMAFSLRMEELIEFTNEKLPAWYEIVDIKLLCGNNDGTILETYDKEWANRRFKWTCLYSEKGTYTYWIEITYDNTVSKERKTEQYNLKSLNFDSSITLNRTVTTSSSSSSKSEELKSSNGEFILWKAPAKISADSTQVFRDFWIWRNWYYTEWDMDWDFENDRINQINFDYSYNIPKIYYVTYKFPELSDEVRYRFPVRVEPSDIPVCVVTAESFTWSTKYHISTNFIDPGDVAKISSYNYKITNVKNKNVLEELKNQTQEISYILPEEWTYVVILDYVTVDGKQWRCESEPIQLKKERFNVQYSILELRDETGKFKELCNSNDWCKEINLNKIPQTYQLQIKSITPSNATLNKVVTFNDTPILNDNDTYTFNIPNEGVYELKIITSDVSEWMDEERIIINITAKKPDIVGDMSITLADAKTSVTEWFEPLTVLLDASKTEVNIDGDDIIYFTWDFGDGSPKKNNIQNWIVSHTYNYDYEKENWIFEPEVTVKTRGWKEETIKWPTLNVKKWLINVEISPTSHPSRQAPVWTNVTFAAEFDWLPEKMTWDFGDASDPITCKWRDCSEISHTFEKAGLVTIKLTLEFDTVQEVEKTMEFKVY